MFKNKTATVTKKKYTTNTRMETFISLLFFFFQLV